MGNDEAKGFRMLKDLLDYLNQEIYPNLPKKKLKEIKQDSLGGGLMDIINKYKNFEVQKALDIKNEEYKVDIESYKATIKRLREGNESEAEYRKGRFGKTN